jgi:hypothetical protein
LRRELSKSAAFFFRGTAANRQDSYEAEEMYSR